MLIQNIGQINDVTPWHLMNSCKMLYKVVKVKKEAFFPNLEVSNNNNITNNFTNFGISAFNTGSKIFIGRLIQVFLSCLVLL